MCKYKTTEQILNFSDVYCRVTRFPLTKNSFTDNIPELGEVEIIEFGLVDGIAICTREKIFLGVQNSKKTFNSKKCFLWKNFIISKMPCNKDLFKCDHIDTSYLHKSFSDPFECIAAQNSITLEVMKIIVKLKSEIKKIANNFGNNLR